MMFSVRLLFTCDCFLEIFGYVDNLNLNTYCSCEQWHSFAFKHKFCLSHMHVFFCQFSGQCADDMRKTYAEFCSRHLKAVKLYKELLARDKKFQCFIRVRQTQNTVKHMEIHSMHYITKEKREIIISQCHTGGELYVLYKAFVKYIIYGCRRI